MILSSIWGWIAGFLLIIFNAVVDHKVSITFVVAVVVMDLIWGIFASVKMKKFTTSELMRDTVAKFAVYGTAILTFCFLDKMIGESVTLTTVVICSVIMLVELWSSCANALIVFPNFPFLRLMLPVLEGEIANKLHIETNKVREVLYKEVKK